MKPQLNLMKAVVFAWAVLYGIGFAEANAFREKGKLAQIAGSPMSVNPPGDWNRLDVKPGKRAETWTLDGEQLNDVTFYGGISAGEPLLRERNKKREPLPKFTKATLLAEVPELLENTYRTNRKIGSFVLSSSGADQFLRHDGIRFSYEYTDADALPRKGEARAAIIGGKLYMATFDAPRLHFFAKTIEDYRALAETAQIIE